MRQSPPEIKGPILQAVHGLSHTPSAPGGRLTMVWTLVSLLVVVVGANEVRDESTFNCA
jgi:hypothetical protein